MTIRLTHANPDLGEFIEQTDEEYWNDVNIGTMHVGPHPHQVYYRVESVSAGYRQGLVVWPKEGSPAESFPDPQHWPINVTANGLIPWAALDQHDVEYYYYFGGLYRGDGSYYLWDAGLHWIRERWTNGILYKYGYDDTGADWDWDDLRVDVALVWTSRGQGHETEISDKIGGEPLVEKEITSKAPESPDTVTSHRPSC